MWNPRYPVATPRLLLRPLTAADAVDLLQYQSRADVCRYLPYEARNELDVRAWLADPQRNRSTCEAEGQELYLGVQDRESGRVIGDVMLAWRSREHRRGELGYVFNPDYGGRGLATEAAESLLDLGFGELGLLRVVAYLDARNERSAALLRRLAMRQEGHLVQTELFRGEWIDELEFAILADEWRTQRSQSVKVDTTLP